MVSIKIYSRPPIQGLEFEPLVLTKIHWGSEFQIWTPNLKRLWTEFEIFFNHGDEIPYLLESI